MLHAVRSGKVLQRTSVVFNPENVQDTATFERPHQFALGMDYVMVNGILVQQDGVPTEERPGLVLRR